ncbi:hypothetical protein ALQ78_101271 [Pseudomonas syringae pv. aptata]|nr:Unknown protein sequence [Pseudomonas syringae pv. syringae]RMM48113.1 hypothetical protein ALQ78_101271 [Pseudomonas syringae pv. aptata]
MLCEKHQQGWSTVRGSARLHWLLKPHKGHSAVSGGAVVMSEVNAVLDDRGVWFRPY